MAAIRSRAPRSRPARRGRARILGVLALFGVVLATLPTPSGTVEVRIQLHAVEAEVDPRFLSVAVDMAQVVGGRFWDPRGGVGVLGAAPVPVYDFVRPRLRALAAELAPAYLHIGGSDADRVYYDLSSTPAPEPPEGFEGVLTAAQLEGIFDFATDLDYQVTLTLNAGPAVRDGNGTWRDAMARSLVRYVVDRGHSVALWELGNEWNAFVVIHGVDGTVPPPRMARDFAAARALLDELAPGALLGGPGSAHWPLLGEVNPITPAFVEAGGLRFLDVVTWHYYPQQSARCPLSIRRAEPETMLEPEHLDEIDAWAGRVERIAAHRELPVWLGESGHAQCGGQPGVSDRFVSSFWWLDQLARLARRGQRVVVRQTLSGSDYGLLDDVSLEPRPDYWASVVWRRLMGTRVLAVDPPALPAIRAYAHCTRGVPGGVTALLLHLDPKRGRVVSLPGLRGRGELYRLTADELLASEVRLNGVLLVDRDGALPPLASVRVAPGSSIELPPASIAFVSFPDARAPACR